MSAQEALRLSWLQGPEGRLSGREQAKAWALREVWREDGKAPYGLFTFVAARVRKTRNGRPTGDHPSVASVKEFFTKIDADPDWHPGKHCEERRGPKRVLRGPKRTAIASAAKRLKHEGQEPTFAAIVAACPEATRNPATNEAVDKKLVYTVFRELCYDVDAGDRWCHLPRLSRAALDDAARARRWAFAKHMLALRHTEAWYYDNLVWCDLCNSVLPRTQKKAAEMVLARKGGKGWMSKGAQAHSQNLRGPRHVLKLSSSDTVRVWWTPVLTRGKLHIEPLPDDFPGETPLGAEIMVAKVRSALNVRFPGGAAPRILFTDRGNGFFHSGSGAMTVEYRAALKRNRLRAFFATNASVQPGQLQEVMLHETAVSCMRARLTKTAPKKSWGETLEAYRSRLKDCAAHINDHHDVSGLCQELPSRLLELHLLKGDRLSK